MGQKAIGAFTLLGIALPAESTAVNMDNRLFVKTTEAGHRAIERLYKGFSSKLPPLIEANATFITIPRAEVAAHPDMRRRGSLSQEAVLEMWRAGKATLLSQQKVIAPSGVNSQVEGVEEIMYPSDLIRPKPGTRSLGPESTPPGAFTPGNFQTREVGAIFNMTATRRRDGILYMALIPEMVLMLDHDGHVLGEPGHLHKVAPPFESMNLTTSVQIKPGSTLVCGGATWTEDRVGYMLFSADLLGEDGERLAVQEEERVGDLPEFVLEEVRTDSSGGWDAFAGVDPKEALEIMGMSFPEGASAHVENGVLRVFNRPENMDVLDHFRGETKSQIEIDATFVRFTLDELRQDADFVARGAASPAGLLRLWQAGNGTLVQSQKLITLDGVNAQFEGVYELVYPGQVTETNVVFESREVGMILNVTPNLVKAGEDGEVGIRLTLIPEIAILDRWLEQEDGSRSPIFASHNVTSTVTLQSGGIMVLGGSASPDPTENWLEVLLIRAALIDSEGGGA